MSLLAINVGNSNISLALFRGDQLEAHWRLQTVRERTADEYTAILRSLICPLLEPQGNVQVTGAAMSCVVPGLGEVMRQVVRVIFGFYLMEIGPETNTGMPVEYFPLSSLGADRVVNAVAAYSKYGGPCVVVDMGTATNYEVVSTEGVLLGGAIAPGIGISMDALFQRAPRLPRVDLAPPPDPIGRSTLESLQSGILYGFVGQIEGLVHRYCEMLGPSTVVVATGGFSEVIARETPCIHHVEPWLTLDGIRLIWERLRTLKMTPPTSG